MAMRNYGQVRLVRQPGGGFRPMRGFSSFGDGANNWASDSDYAAGVAALNRAHLLPQTVFPVNSEAWSVLWNHSNLLDAIKSGALNINDKRAELIERTNYLNALSGSTGSVVTPLPPVVIAPGSSSGGGGLLDGYITLPVVGTISKKTAALVAAGLAAYFFLQD